MRIGIARSLVGSNSGGVFQYEIVFLRALGELVPHLREELVYLCYHPTDLSTLLSAGGLNYSGIPVVPVGKPAFVQDPPETYLAQKPVAPPPISPHDVKFNYVGGDAIRQNGVELLVLLSPNLPPFSFRLPFVVPLFDLNHRLQPEFPEVSAYGEANGREHLYINTCRFATLVLVDSEAGKSDVLRFYGDYIDEDRVRILPYYPPIKDRPL